MKTETYRVGLAPPVCGAAGVLGAAQAVLYRSGIITWEMPPFWHGLDTAEGDLAAWGIVLLVVGSLWLILLGIVVRIRLSDYGIEYRTFTRRVRVAWEEIHGVRLRPHVGGFEIMLRDRTIAVGYLFARQVRLKSGVAAQVRARIGEACVVTVKPRVLPWRGRESEDKDADRRGHDNRSRIHL